MHAYRMLAIKGVCSMAKIVDLLATDAAIALGGIVEIPAALLTTLGAEGYARNGVILANERKSFTLMQDGKQVPYTMSIYVQRAAMTEGEQAAVDATKNERDASKRERAEAEQAKREREIAQAQKLGGDAVLSALRTVQSMGPALAVLNGGR